MAISTVASQMGITASPIAAAAAVVLATATDNNLDISLINVLVVTIPATFIGMLAAATWSLRRGKDLDKDAAYLERMKDPEFAQEAAGASAENKDTEVGPGGRRGLFIFLLGILCVIMVALTSKRVLPAGVGMSVAIQFLMLSVGAFILLFTKVKPKDIVHSSVFTAGMVAVITIFGIAWLSDTIIGHHKEYIISMVSSMVDHYPGHLPLPCSSSPYSSRVRPRF